MTLGWSEIFVVILFALIVFGPKRLPEIARQIGRAVREVRRVSSDFEREVRSVTGDFEREVRGVTGEFQAEAKHFERDVKTNFALDADHSSYRTETRRRPAGEASPPDRPASGPGGDETSIPPPARPQPAPPMRGSEHVPTDRPEPS